MNSGLEHELIPRAFITDFYYNIYYTVVGSLLF